MNALRFVTSMERFFDKDVPEISNTDILNYIFARIDPQITGNIAYMRSIIDEVSFRFLDEYESTIVGGARVFDLDVEFENMLQRELNEEEINMLNNDNYDEGESLVSASTVISNASTEIADNSQVNMDIIMDYYDFIGRL